MMRIKKKVSFTEEVISYITKLLIKKGTILANILKIIGEQDRKYLQTFFIQYEWDSGRYVIDQKDNGTYIKYLKVHNGKPVYKIKVYQRNIMCQEPIAFHIDKFDLAIMSSRAEVTKYVIESLYTNHTIKELLCLGEMIEVASESLLEIQNSLTTQINIKE